MNRKSENYISDNSALEDQLSTNICCCGYGKKYKMHETILVSIPLKAKIADIVKV